MSDTDDTDILLLIPPNFFLEHNSGSENSLLESSRTVVHKPPSCTSQIIGKLVTQVHSLENRLESLELSTTSDISSRDARFYCNRTLDFSIDSHSADRKSNTFPRLRKRKVVPRRQKRREHSLTSLESTSSCGNIIPPLTLKGELFRKPLLNEFQMDGDVSSIVSTPSKKNDKLLLNEIDEFLHKVESYEGPEASYKAPEVSLSSDNVIRATGDYMSQKFDIKGRQDEDKSKTSAILNKYIYLAEEEPVSKSETKKEDINVYPSTSLITEAKSPAQRKLNFVETKDVQPTSTPKREHLPQRPYLDRFRPSTNKIYDRASKVLEQYKSSYSRNDDTVHTSMLDSTKNDFKITKPYGDRSSDSQKYIESIDTKLLSLSELWGERGDKGDSGKLEEERLKREHCESLIQELQKKLLSQQEKLAVAVKVDRAKDQAISKLRHAWIELTSNIDKNDQRYKSAHERMAAEVEKYRIAASDAQKKTAHFEAELYKTLDLAHDYQNKCKQLTKEKQDVDMKIAEVIHEKDTAIRNKDNEMQSMKENYETVASLNKQSHDCIKNLENALDKEKKEHESTQAKLLELVSKTSNINEETNLILQERDLQRERVNEERARNHILEKQLTEKETLILALQKREETLETELIETRKLFDFQKNELKCHYQKQLEDAVTCKLHEFQMQLDQAEREMADDMRAKETNILDNCNKQITRIQEQHKLEINVLEEKHKEEVKLYRLQLAQANENITMLESKLSNYRRRRSELASQLHGVMQTQWRQALNILTHTNANSQDVTIASTPLGEPYSAPKMPLPTMPTYMEPPTSQRHFEERICDKFNFEGLSDNELQHYVKSFLTKPPNALQANEPLDTDTRDEEPTSDQPKHRSRRSLNKPPWKS